MPSGPTLSHTSPPPRPAVALDSTSPTRDPRCQHLLRTQEWLRLATTTTRLRTPWKTVHHYYFRTWRIDCTWEKLNAAVRERLRARIKRNTHPSAAIVDSQAVKTTGVGGERGYDSAKKVKGTLSAIYS